MIHKGGMSSALIVEFPLEVQSCKLQKPHILLFGAINKVTD